MEVFYKGEDVSITAGLFVDKSMKIPVALSEYNIDMLIFSQGKEMSIFCSTISSNNDLHLIAVGDHIVKTIIPSNILESLEIGQIKFEIRLTNRSDNTKKIQCIYAFILEDSRIKSR